jgi:hypothetical protein
VSRREFATASPYIGGTPLESSLATGIHTNKLRKLPLGLIGVPLIGAAAAIGLILFFVCALYTHVRASDFSAQFALAIGYLVLAVAALVLVLAVAQVRVHDLR